jgi:hypothetical protein
MKTVLRLETQVDGRISNALGFIMLSLRSENYQNRESIKHTLLTNMTLRMSSCAVPLHKQANQNTC